MKRRSFIQRSLIAAAASAWSRLPSAFASSPPKRILVLGGTFFLGPAVVEAAIAEGHTVTLFNRGITNPELFPYLEKLRGFRSGEPDNEDLSALTRRRFDVAIDVWPSDPAMVASAAALLKDRVEHYLYVSSVSAYDSKNLVRAGLDESASLEPWNGPGHQYNREKAESQRRLHAILGEKLTIVCPGPIMGDRSLSPDVVTWLMRAQSGGQHIGPGDGTDPVELVDVKDVARFLMLAIGSSLYGTFNLTGRPMPFREFLDACNTTMRSGAQFVWIPHDFLRQHGLETDFALGVFAGNFPLWRPVGDNQGLCQISSEKAFRAGWQTRPFNETALDALAYFRPQAPRLYWSDYLPPEKEKQVLDAWLHRPAS